MRSKTILVVDDDGDSRIICATILTHHGYRVLEADDGIDAVELAREILPDLILMDLALPSLDGWEAMRRLRADPATRHIPVVVLTAYAENSDRRKKRQEAGAAGYLTKPCSPTRVLEEVRRLTDDGGEPVAPEVGPQST